MRQQKYVVRANKGKPRIWIEGKRLTAAGFKAGDRFELMNTNASDSLLIRRRPEGGRRVSGNDSRPIIDLSGASCAPFATGDAVTITYSSTTILVKADV